MNTSDVLDELTERAVALAWSLWAELGVSSWWRAHEEWAVELEPLVAFTAILREHDPRLFGEAVDWCVANDRFVSLKQYRHVVNDAQWPYVGPIGDFGATVAAHTKRRWPFHGQPATQRLSGKSASPDLTTPSTLGLRLRAIMGVSARAEIIRVMLVSPRKTWTVRQVSDRVAYTQRQISSDMDMLAAGGVVTRETGSPAHFVIADPRRLISLFGPLPKHVLNWGPTFAVLHGVTRGLHEAMAATAPDTALTRSVRLLAPQIRVSGLAVPHPDAYIDYVEVMVNWALHTLRTLAVGVPIPLVR